MTMYHQTAIRISRDADNVTFAHALQMTLERLEAEDWDSRIFQFGNEGVMIVASRPEPVEPPEVQPFVQSEEVSEELLPVAEPDDWFSLFEMLDPLARNALDRIYDVLGPVPDEELVDALEIAVPVALGHYSARMLQRVSEQLDEHRRQHLAGLAETDDHGYVLMLQTVVEHIEELVRRRLN